MEKMKLRFFGGLTFRSKQRMHLHRIFVRLFKFCSREVDAESEGIARGAHNHDPLVTRTGGFFHLTNFDEVPQRLNILKGDMSPSGRRIIFA